MATQTRSAHAQTISQGCSAARSALSRCTSGGGGDDVDDATTSAGISLLSLKAVLFTDYLVHLCYYILHRLRGASLGSRQELLDALVDLRIDLDRGVRPLEQKLKYQIDKAIRASDRADAAPAGKAQAEGGEDALRYAPRLNDLAGSDDDDAASDASSNGGGGGGRRGGSSKSGVYRPPRIAATLPAEDAAQRRERRRPNATLREFADDALSGAPVAEPSIGSNITTQRQGRRSVAAVESARDRGRREDVRRYEEENYTRLPTTGKEKRKGRGAGRDDVYGGEDFRMLDAGLYDDVAARAGTGRGSALSRSRKRQSEGDGDAGAGGGGDVRIGDAFKRRKGALKGRRSTYR